jgi:hypothetical protein
VNTVYFRYILVFEFSMDFFVTASTYLGAWDTPGLAACLVFLNQHGRNAGASAWGLSYSANLLVFQKKWAFLQPGSIHHGSHNYVKCLLDVT